jgi:hypothetical protein
LRNIYIVTKTSCFANTIKYFTDPVIVIDESIFPFADQIAIYHGKNSRNGWYLQQLIKLYAGLVVPGILDRYLVIDGNIYLDCVVLNVVPKHHDLVPETTGI